MVKNLQKTGKKSENLESILGIFSELLDASASDFDKYNLRNYLIKLYIKISSISNRGEDSVFSENSKTPAHLYMLKRIKENLLRNGCEFEKPQVNDCSDSVDFNEANLEEGVR